LALARIKAVHGRSFARSTWARSTRPMVPFSPCLEQWQLLYASDRGVPCGARGPPSFALRRRPFGQRRRLEARTRLLRPPEVARPGTSRVRPRRNWSDDLPGVRHVFWRWRCHREFRGRFGVISLSTSRAPTHRLTAAHIAEGRAGCRWSRVGGGTGCAGAPRAPPDPPPGAPAGLGHRHPVPRPDGERDPIGPRRGTLGRGRARRTACSVR